MLQEVLNNHCPDSWDTSILYDDKRYHLSLLSESTSEFNKVTKPFQDVNLKVASVRRVQNPFILGRYILEKEKKEAQDDTVDEIVAYHRIIEADLESAMEYNMDVRRYGNRHSHGKNPTFYKTPAFALTSSSSASMSKTIIIVCKVMNDGNVTWDTEYMPEYVVELA